MKPIVHMPRPWTETLALSGARLTVSSGTPITFDVPAGGLVLWGRPRVIRGGAGRPKVQQ